MTAAPAADPAADPYAVLRLPRFTPTDAEIKARQRSLLRAVHPDANPDVDESERAALDREAAAINAAADALLRHRAEIDRALRQAEMPASEPAPAPAEPVAPETAPWSGLAQDRSAGQPAAAPSPQHIVPTPSAEWAGLAAWLRFTSRGQWTAFALWVLSFSYFGLVPALGFAVVQLALAGDAYRTTPAWRLGRLLWQFAGLAAGIGVAGVRIALPLAEALVGRAWAALFPERRGVSRQA